MTIKTRPRPARWLTLLIVIAVTAACGSDGDSAATTNSSPPATTTTSEPEQTTLTDATTSTADNTSTTATSTSSATALPGTDWPYGLIKDGDVLAVMAVAYDDTLNLRAGPGTDQSVLATLGPTEVALVATGRQRLLPSSGIWTEVELDGTTGWVSSSFIAYMGGTDDFTSQYIADFGRSEAGTMEELGEIIAANVASEDPPSQIVRSVGASVGDLGEVTYDVIGLGDDALAGYRLHIFALDEGSSGTFEVTSIERTTFCTRGLSGEACV